MRRPRQPPAALVALVLLVACTAAAGVQGEAFTGVYGGVTCSADALVQPSSTAELAAAIQQFVVASKQSGKPLKIRTTRNHFHSSASFPCPFTSNLISSALDSSSASPSTVAVLQSGMTQILEVDKAAFTVRAQSGLQVVQLLRWAEQNGMSPPLGAPTNYGDLSLGGVISAGGHGTGANTSATMGSIALEFTWVDASGGVHVSPRDSDEARGLVSGMGLIGIITEVKLQLTALTKTKATSINLLPDANLAADVKNYLKATPHVAIMWRPDLKKYNAFLMSQTDLPPKPPKQDQAGLVFPLPTLMSNAFQMVLLPLQKDINDTAVSRALNPINCMSSFTSLAYLRWASKPLLPVSIPGAPLDPSIAQIEAIGSTNRMMCGGCEPYCVWNSEITVDEIGMAIELDDLEGWVADVKRIFELDLHEGGRAKDRCLPFGGYIFIRFGQSTPDFLAATSGMKLPVFVELTWLKSRKLPHAPGKYIFVQEIMEQLTLCKYKGRPHWGKNYDRTFTSPACPLRDNLPFFDKQLQLQAKYDPDKRLEPLLMQQVVRRAPNLYSPRCALSHECFCAEDGHCAEGFVCVPALSFPEYKTCKPAGAKPKWG